MVLGVCSLDVRSPRRCFRYCVDASSGQAVAWADDIDFSAMNVVELSCCGP